MFAPLVYLWNFTYFFNFKMTSGDCMPKQIIELVLHSMTGAAILIHRPMISLKKSLVTDEKYLWHIQTMVIIFNLLPQNDAILGRRLQ